MNKFLLAVFLCALPVLANSEFRVRRMMRNDVPFGKGQCDIRLQVDGEAEVSVRGDMVYIRTISGRDARDDGSECNAPFTGRDAQGFNFDVRESRGDIRLLEPPSPRNGFRVLILIRDSKGGEGRYHFRLSWMTQGGPPVAGPPPDYRPSYPPAGPPRRFTTEKAIAICQDAVRNRIADQYNLNSFDFRNERLDDNPGRNDYILGDLVARRGPNRMSFGYVCRVDFSTGRVKTVDVRPR